MLPVEQALRIAGGDTRVFPVIFDKARRVESYGSAHRIFTEGQRLAMIARDQGCSFPRCSVGPNWTEAHHIVNFALGGPTSIENGTMLCGYDHDHHLAAGWSCRMIDGRPHWTPPLWIDKTQTPRRNHAHDPALARSTSRPPSEFPPRH